MNNDLEWYEKEVARLDKLVVHMHAEQGILERKIRELRYQLTDALGLTPCCQNRHPLDVPCGKPAILCIHREQAPICGDCVDLFRKDPQWIPLLDDALKPLPEKQVQTLRRTQLALAALSNAAELVGEKLFIVQPFFDVYKIHGAVIEAAKQVKP